jgi:hypothetical protein
VRVALTLTDDQVALLCDRLAAAFRPGVAARDL